MSEPHYDEAYYLANGQLGDRPALRYYTRVAARYSRPSRSLDIGCGTGHLLARMSRRWDADGLELSAYSAEVARRTSPGSTVWEQGADLPDEAYDMFSAVHVFEHIPDEPLEELLVDLRRSSRPGARLLVVVPDPAGRAHELHGDRWNALSDPTHVNMKSHRAWADFFLAHDLVVERESSDGLWNFPYSGLPVPLDALRYGLPMAAQFLAGRMWLAPGSGESSLFVLRWKN